MIKKLLLMFLIVVIIINIVGFIDKGDIEWNTKIYKVKSGDTLYGIAERYCPETVDIRNYVYKIKKINKIGSIIYPYQEIKILVSNGGGESE